MAMGAMQAACRHSPSYSDIKVDKDGSLANSNAARPQPEPSVEAANPLVPLPGSSAGVDPSASPSGTAPSFLDTKTGQIKNLPLYPGAKVRGLQFGPMNGTTQATLQALTRAPFEKVTAFYDQVIRENGWIIDDSSREPNSYTWQLRRGQSDRAAIRVDKDQIGRVTIALARAG